MTKGKTNVVRAHLAWLASIYGFGAVEIGKVLSFFERVEQVMEASRRELREAGLSDLKAERLEKRREETDPQAYLEGVEKMGFRLVSVFDSEYPGNLKKIKTCPYALFVRGEFRPEDERAVAVVGTRKPTVYGKKMTERLVVELASQGVTVVSGLAYGVDAIAHRAVLESGGRTVAVLGSGIDKIQPAGNASLGKEIAKSGVVVSEYPPGRRAMRQTFPARNRLVSGLSKGVLVMEGTGRSGSLITAAFARKQGRVVMAVPGEVDNRMSEAPLALIKEGASMVTGGEEVVRVLGLGGSLRKQNKDGVDISRLEGDERRVAEMILDEGKAVAVDKLARQLGWPVSRVTGVVTMLELSGVVKVIEGKVAVG